MEPRPNSHVRRLSPSTCVTSCDRRVLGDTLSDARCLAVFNGTNTAKELVKQAERYQIIMLHVDLTIIYIYRLYRGSKKEGWHGRL